MDIRLHDLLARPGVHLLLDDFCVRPFKRALTSRGVSVMMPLWEGRNVQGLLRTGGGRPHAGWWLGEAFSC